MKHFKQYLTEKFQPKTQQTTNTFTDIPDGKYKGIQSGNEVKFTVDQKEYTFKTIDGIRGTVNVIVEIKSGIPTIILK